MSINDKTTYVVVRFVAVWFMGSGWRHASHALPVDPGGGPAHTTDFLLGLDEAPPHGEHKYHNDEDHQHQNTWRMYTCSVMYV